MFAVISDIHGNLEALQTVLEDIRRRGITEVYCLGDVIGYGASPRECLDLVGDHCKLVLCGNHDQAVFYEPYNFNIGAERACYWTRRVLEEESDKDLRDRRWELLGRLPQRAEAHDLLLVHASPRRPINEYLFAEDVYTNPNKILANFERLEPHHLACLVGHTHVPGVFLEDPFFEQPGDLTERNCYTITTDEKAIINVGSVGQPRDWDPRASYVVVYERGDLPDGDGRLGGRSTNGDGKQLTVEFIRLEYDVDRAMQRILDEPELDNFLGTRLLEGR